MFAIVIGMICCTGFLYQGEGRVVLGEIGRALYSHCGDEIEGSLLASDVSDYEIPDDELFMYEHQ